MCVLPLNKGAVWRVTLVLRPKQHTVLVIHLHFIHILGFYHILHNALAVYRLNVNVQNMFIQNSQQTVLA